jgi:hypothetical protein
MALAKLREEYPNHCDPENVPLNKGLLLIGGSENWGRLLKDS